MRRERDRRVQSGRADPFAVFVLSLSPKVWLDANGLPAGLLSTWTDKSGSGNNATAAGGLRPTVSGAEVQFAGAQRMVTPSFAMGARSSGACVARFSATNMGAFQFGPLNSHHSVLTQNTPSDQVKVRAMAGGAGDAGIAASYPQSAVLAWAFDASGGTVVVNGTSVAMGASAIASLTDVLTIGDLTGGIFALTGAIHEVVLIDAVISGANLTALHSGMRTKWSL